MKTSSWDPQSLEKAEHNFARVTNPGAGHDFGERARLFTFLEQDLDTEQVYDLIRMGLNCVSIGLSIQPTMPMDNAADIG